MQIGDLDQRITIQSFTVETDANGQDLPVWSTLKTVWAKVLYERADESTEADQLVAASIVKFIIRDTTITEVMRIRWEGNYYRVLGIEEIGLNRYLAVRTEWKDSRWFDILRDTGHGVRKVDDDTLRTVGYNQGEI